MDTKPGVYCNWIIGGKAWSFRAKLTQKLLKSNEFCDQNLFVLVVADFKFN